MNFLFYVIFSCAIMLKLESHVFHVPAIFCYRHASSSSLGYWKIDLFHVISYSIQLSITTRWWRSPVFGYFFHRDSNWCNQNQQDAPWIESTGLNKWVIFPCNCKCISWCSTGLLPYTNSIALHWENISKLPGNGSKTLFSNPNICQNDSCR